MGIYKVHESNLEALKAKANTIAKKCARYNCEFEFFVDDTPIYEQHKDDDGIIRTYKFFNVTANGVAKVNGWEFVATLEHKETGNIIRKAVDSLPVPEKYRHTKAVCEHCNTLRNRKDTYLIYNTATGEYKQVGKSCLKDFTGGLDVEWCAHLATFEEELNHSEAISSGWSNPSYINVKDLLAASALVISEFGYVPTNGFGLTTRDASIQLYNEHHGLPDDLGKAQREELHSRITKSCDDPSAQQTAERALAWLQAQDNTDYIHNVKMATGSTHCSRRDSGLVVSLVHCYLRAAAREERKALARKQDSASEWVGAIGEKLDTPVAKATCVTSWETEWGYTFLYKFITEDGNILIWKTGVDVELESVQSIKGTIKNHNDYNGTKQTELTRCKVTYKPDEQPSPAELERARKAQEELNDALNAFFNN